MPVILAIESSCDDTSIAIVKDGEILSNITSTQIQHKKYGGVIPELASRQHHIDIIPTLEEALQVAKIDKKELKAIAFTKGPGLLGSLIVGVSFSKALALALNVPLIEVHHMHAHILSHFAELPHPGCPFLCLTVSGGHTQIVKVSEYNQMEILGSTIDDAAGEAFDKVGKMLDLPYPAGPEIDKLASKGNPILEFSKPNIKGYNYSFSGFKTSVLYKLRDIVKENPNYIKDNLEDICAAVQKSIIEILLHKFTAAIMDTGIKNIAIAGGVAANSELRSELKTYCVDNKLKLFIPAMQYCTDNAGMVGAAAWFKFLNKDFVDQTVVPDARFQF
jgi:N6-L-threonylcarbamoyladenine synthase